MWCMEKVKSILIWNLLFQITFLKISCSKVLNEISFSSTIALVIQFFPLCYFFGKSIIKQNCMIGKGAIPSFFAIANYNYTLTS